MTGLTEQNRLLVMTEVCKQPYATRFAKKEIDHALESAVSIFSNVEQRFVPGFCGVLLRPGGVQRPTDFALELIPGLVYAHRFFGNSLPVGLKQKLRNQPQTHNTLFELMCLGAFQPHHVLQYEPTLADGKAPDLVLSLPSGQPVYVECKSQSLRGPKHQRLFIKATEHIHKMLNLKESTFVKKAWANGLRSEVHLSQTPSDADLNELQEAIEQYAPNKGMSPIRFGASITLSLIPRERPFDEGQPPPSAVIEVGLTPTSISSSNAHTAVYPWPGLDIIRRRSQRRLLASARRKLGALPPCAYGLICIETFSSKKFAPDILRLLPQKPFERIPIVWLNPFRGGQVIARDDALPLRNQIFEGLLKTSGDNANKTIDGNE